MNNGQFYYIRAGAPDGLGRIWTVALICLARPAGFEPSAPWFVGDPLSVNALLDDIKAHVAANGQAIINVLTVGTTYLGMFEPGHYYLFGRNELEEQFKGWNILLSRHDSFDAPGNTRKEFATIVARKE